MIPVDSVARAILYNLGEMYNRNHSDPELIEAINAVLRCVNLVLINKESNWITKEMDIKRLRNGRAALPSDFAKMKGYTVTQDGVEKEYEGKYRIVKDTIYVDTTGRLSYYYVIPEVETMEDEIDLPYIFLELFIRYATGLLDGSFGKGALDGLISSEVDGLAGTANYPVIERPMQFYV